MKELCYKRELSQDMRKKVISVQGELEGCDRRLQIHKKYYYDIKEEKVLRSQSEFNDIIRGIQAGKALNHIYIKRIVDTKSGTHTISYIGKGELFALYKNKLYRVCYKHEHVVESRPKA